MRELETELVDAIIAAYHTTRLRETPVAMHILSKPHVKAAIAAFTQGIEAGTAETGIPGSGRKDESPVAESDAPDHPTATDWQNRAYRAEAECKELRAKLDHALDDINELGARLAIELAASQHGAG